MCVFSEWSIVLNLAVDCVMAKIRCHTCDGVMSRDVSFTTHWLASSSPQPRPGTLTVSLSSCLSSLLDMS